MVWTTAVGSAARHPVGQYASCTAAAESAASGLSLAYRSRLPASSSSSSIAVTVSTSYVLDSLGDAFLLRAVF